MCTVRWHTLDTFPAPLRCSFPGDIQVPATRPPRLQKCIFSSIRFPKKPGVCHLALGSCSPEPRRSVPIVKLIKRTCVHLNSIAHQISYRIFSNRSEFLLNSTGKPGKFHLQRLDLLHLLYRWTLNFSFLHRFGLLSEGHDWREQETADTKVALSVITGSALLWCRHHRDEEHADKKRAETTSKTPSSVAAAGAPRAVVRPEGGDKSSALSWLAPPPTPLIPTVTSVAWRRAPPTGTHRTHSCPLATAGNWWTEKPSFSVRGRATTSITQFRLPTRHLPRRARRAAAASASKRRRRKEGNVRDAHARIAKPCEFNGFRVGFRQSCSNGSRIGKMRRGPSWIAPISTTVLSLPCSPSSALSGHFADPITVR